jgi:hypothetical protein
LAAEIPVPVIGDIIMETLIGDLVKNVTPTPSPESGNEAKSDVEESGHAVPVAGTERDITSDEDQNRPVIPSTEEPESKSQHELAEAAESISTDGAHPVEELLQSEVVADGVQIEGSISLEAENRFAESSVMEQNAADSPQTEESVPLRGTEERAFTGETADGSPVVVPQSSIVEGAPAEESPIIGDNG